MSAADEAALQKRALVALIRQAEDGHRDAAIALIADFAEIAKDPHCFDAVGGVPLPLMQYIATCLADWQKRGFKDAETWFRVVKPAHAPVQTNGRHVRAMRAYLLLRGRSKGVDAAKAAAAAYSGLTEAQVDHLVRKPKRPSWFKGPVISELEFAALMGIRESLHQRVLNPPRKNPATSRRT